MIDYSEVTAGMQIRCVEMNTALNDRKLLKARSIALGLSKDTTDIVILIDEMMKKADNETT